MFPKQQSGTFAARRAGRTEPGDIKVDMARLVVRMPGSLAGVPEGGVEEPPGAAKHKTAPATQRRSPTVTSNPKIEKAVPARSHFIEPRGLATGCGPYGSPPRGVVRRVGGRIHAQRPKPQISPQKVGEGGDLQPVEGRTARPALGRHSGRDHGVGEVGNPRVRTRLGQKFDQGAVGPMLVNVHVAALEELIRNEFRKAEARHKFLRPRRHELRGSGGRARRIKGTAAARHEPVDQRGGREKIVFESARGGNSVAGGPQVPSRPGRPSAGDASEAARDESAKHGGGGQMRSMSREKGDRGVKTVGRVRRKAAGTAEAASP